MGKQVGLVADSSALNRNKEVLIMVKFTILLQAIVLAVILSHVPSASAETARFLTKINRILQDDSPNAYAGCMAIPSIDPATLSGVSCRRGWVTMDCTGELGTSKRHSTALFNSMQAALMLNQNVWLTLDDDRTASGYCLVQILESYPPS